MGLIVGLALGYVVGIWLCVSAYNANEEPILQAKHECEKALPRNLECVWTTPSIDSEAPAASGEEG